jgi:hypothetical protein
MRATLAALILGFAPGCERAQPPREAAPASAPLAAVDLEAVRGARVFFAHGSVGANVLEGVAQIPDSGIALAERALDSTAELPARTFSHARFEKDGDPEAKIAGFERVVAGLHPSPDVALLMFDDADLGAATDTHALFTHYRVALTRLRAAHPETVFVHVTAPLAVRETGAAELIERLTGFSDAFARANARRAEYDTRVREAYRGQPIFDLAAIHDLAVEGRERAAHALIEALAEALRRRPAR